MFAFSGSLEAQVCKAKDAGSLQSFEQIAIESCEETKKSAECQALYKEFDPKVASDYALNCQLDHDFSSSELTKFQLAGCAMGGVKVAANVVFFTYDAVHGSAKAVGETAAKSVLSLEADFERQKECDKNPDRKVILYHGYNASVPTLLQIPVPDQNSLERKSCAEIEADFYHSKNLKLRTVSQKYDFKLLQKNPTVNSFEEEEYLLWKNNSQEFAASNESGMTRMVDQALRDYDIKIQCYNVFRRMQLRCEAYANLALLGGIGLKGIHYLAGLRSRQVVNAAAGGAAARTESVEIIQWWNKSHTDILIDGKIYNISVHEKMGFRQVRANSFKAWEKAGIPITRTKIAVTPDELAQINATADKLVSMTLNPFPSTQRFKVIYSRYKNDHGLSCSGSVCAILDDATKTSTAPFHVPNGLRISPTFTAAYIRGMSALGNPRIISIETTGKFSLAKYAKTQEVLAGAAIATPVLILEYLGSDGKSKKLAVPAEVKK